MSECAVFYTDGGSRPNNGFGGWGVHGYVFNEESVKKGTGLKDWEITPAGYLSSPKKDESSAKSYNQKRLLHWELFPEKGKDPKVKNVNVIKYVDLSGSLGNPVTNNQAELHALINVFKHILTEEYKRVVLFLDSRHVLDGITEWVPSWVANGWKKKGNGEISNLELWKELYELKTQIDSKTDIVLNWVKGHVGNPGNTKADHNATMGVIASRKQLNTVEDVQVKPEGYWSPKSFMNRITPLKFWYFNSYDSTPILSRDGRVVYHFGDHGKEDDFIGKPLADTCYSIVFLKSPLDNLEIVRKEHSNLDYEGNNTIILAKLDVINNSYNNDLIGKYQSKYLYKETFKNDLYNPMKVQLTKELNPPRIAFNLIEVMGNLYNLLESFLEDDRNKLQIQDITDTFYQRDKKGKNKLDPNLTNTVKSVDLECEYDVGSKKGSKQVTLTLGHDILTRNSLSGLTASNPKVFLITWKESNKAFRYATVIDTGDDVAIFAGFYSNIVLV